MLPQHDADKWDSPSALSKHGGAAIRAGRGGGVLLSPNRTLLGPGWPAGQLPTCGIAQVGWAGMGGLGRDWAERLSSVALERGGAGRGGARRGASLSAWALGKGLKY